MEDTHNIYKIMEPVAKAIKKHLNWPSPEFTEIYNRAYEAVVVGIERGFSEGETKQAILECQGRDKMKSKLKFLDALTDALGDSEGQTPDEIIDELREEGVDVDGMLDRLNAFQKEISAIAKEV